MPMLEAGAKAPAFSLKDQHGATVKLSELKGKHVVVYFYPKDDTPGCTKEACGFRDGHEKLQKAGAVVLGVSPRSRADRNGMIEERRPFAQRTRRGTQCGEAARSDAARRMRSREQGGLWGAQPPANQ